MVLYTSRICNFDVLRLLYLYSASTDWSVGPSWRGWLSGFIPHLVVRSLCRSLSFVTLRYLSVIFMTPVSPSFIPWDVPWRLLVLLKGRDLPRIPSLLTLLPSRRVWATPEDLRIDVSRIRGSGGIRKLNIPYRRTSHPSLSRGSRYLWSF